MPSKEIEQQDKDAELLLTEFFRNERPRSWPEPPWRQPATVVRAGRSLRARFVMVAALVLAAVGLSSLGELPSSWPGAKETFGKGRMEASRPSTPTKTSPLPGFRVPELPKAGQPQKP